MNKNKLLSGGGKILTGGGKWGRRGREVGGEGEGSGVKGGGKWGLGTPPPPRPPPQKSVIYQTIIHSFESARKVHASCRHLLLENDVIDFLSFTFKKCTVAVNYLRNRSALAVNC